MNEDKNISILTKTNSEMLTFFTNRHKECTDNLEHYKTSLFELNIKLDELNKTKSIYSLNTSSKRDLFTPMPKDKTESGKESKIDEEIVALLNEQRLLSAKISEETSNLKFISRKMKLLKAAELSIKDLSLELEDTKSDLTSLEKETQSLRSELASAKQKNSTSDTITSSESEDSSKKLSEMRDEITKHGKNILKIDAFDKSYMSSMLDRKVKTKLNQSKSKLETVKFLISSDPKRAKQTINELLQDMDGINDDITYLLSKVLYNIDTKKPLLDMLEDFISAKKNAHSDCIIETDYKGLDTSSKTSYIAATSLIHLLDIFTENIFKHSHANRIIIKLSNDNNTLSAYIKDNGTGIPDDYMEKSPWYSSIHKANEIIYLLDGKLDIKGSHENGTLVTFSYPI